MRRLLIDPLADPVLLAISDDQDIVRFTEATHKDRAAALDMALAEIMPLDGIKEVVTIAGPGNFTAIRAGIGFARGLALALGVPSKSVGIFEIDAGLVEEAHAVLIRDARGGRVYVAEIYQERVGQVELMQVSDIDVASTFSADVEGAKRIETDAQNRLTSFAKTACKDSGETPAKAQYIRPADAAPSTFKVPQLIDG